MIRFLILASLMLATPGGLAQAHEIKTKDLTISHPWTRATPPGAQTAAGYVTITNHGQSPATLTGGKASFAKAVQLHEDRVTTDGVMQMRALPQGIVIPPGATVTLAPGGLHLMFVGVSEPLQRDRYVDATLIFAEMGSIAVEFFVEPVGVKAPHAH